ncbi:MAG: hypothetical protein PHQ57_05465 [Candidatus Omnitrophica bacterium]|nr:hypothetical protein [Candidatus Omnitrophota bacterium]
MNLGISAVKKAYHSTWRAFKAHPVVFLPFLIFALIDLISLIILYLAPSMPFRLLFGPIIRTFWGEAFLHYPSNFLLLSHLSSLARMVLSVVFGSLLTGMAVFLIFEIYNKKHLNLKAAFKTALKLYLYFFIIVFLMNMIYYFAGKLVNIGLYKYFVSGHTKLLFWGARAWLGPFLIAINMVIAVFVQALLIYAIPVLVVEKTKLLKSIIRSAVLFKQLFIPTIILVALPALIYIPMIILNTNTSFLIQKFFPEFILLIAFLNVIISGLIIDPLITVAATFLYLDHKEKRA